MEGSDVCRLEKFSNYLTTVYKKLHVRLCNTVLLACGQKIRTWNTRIQNKSVAQIPGAMTSGGLNFVGVRLIFMGHPTELSSWHHSGA